MSADVNIKVKIEAAKAQLQLQKLNSQLKITQDRERKVAAQAALAEKRLNEFGNSARRASGGLRTANVALASFIGNITSRAVSAGVTALISGFRRLIVAGREFEDGLVAVGKTTGISGQRLTALGNRITKISREIPVATKELLDIATVAGQLGLKSADDIAQFTETLGKLTLASDIAGEEGAQSVAKILTITGELEQNGSENIDKFGNVITRLGNNFAATESQILKVANRVSQGLAGFGVSSEDVLALGAALKATGSEAEASGTAIQKTFRLIGKAVQDGGEDLKTFADSAGLSSEAFAELFKQDPIKAFERLATNLGQSGKTGAELNATLEKLGLSDERLVRTLNPLIARYGELQRAIADARQESESRTALDEEASKAADTLSGDLQALSNSFDDLAKTIFQELGPALREATQSLTKLLDNINSAVQDKTIQQFAKATGLLTKQLATNNTQLINTAIGLELYELATSQSKKETDDLTKSLQKNSQELNTLLPAQFQVNENYVIATDAIRDYVSAKNNEIRLINEAGDAATSQAAKILLFEQKKLQDLKKFFSEEEQAKLEANFAILKSDRERDAFSRTFITEGQKRQQQAYLKTLSLDRASIESARERQRRLEEFSKNADAYAEEQQQKQFNRIEARKAAELEAATAREALRLFEQEREQIFTDQRLIALEDAFTREEEARIQAGINAAKNEEEKQKLIAEAEARGLDNRLRLKAKAIEDEKKLEKLRRQTLLTGTASLFGALSQLTANGSRRAFEASKAFGIAEATIRGIVATQQALAQPPGPPFTIPLAAAQAVQAAARIQQIRSTQPSFENGGIVGGTSFTGDQIQARVNSGEMILNRQQQSQLFAMANGRGQGDSPTEIVVNTKVQLNEDTIAEAVSRQVANGLILGEVQ